MQITDRAKDVIKSGGEWISTIELENLAVGHPAVAEFVGPLREKSAEWAQLTRNVLQRASGDPEEIGAASYDYLFYSGYVALAYWWARSVAAAADDVDELCDV